MRPSSWRSLNINNYLFLIKLYAKIVFSEMNYRKEISKGGRRNYESHYLIKQNLKSQSL